MGEENRWQSRPSITAVKKGNEVASANVFTKSSVSSSSVDFLGWINSTKRRWESLHSHHALCRWCQLGLEHQIYHSHHKEYVNGENQKLNMLDRTGDPLGQERSMNIPFEINCWRSDNTKYIVSGTNVEGDNKSNMFDELKANQFDWHTPWGFLEGLSSHYNQD